MTSGRRCCRPLSILAVSVLAMIGCTPSEPSSATSNPSECRPTVVRMAPPAEAIEFFAHGSSEPDAAREKLRTANWYGNDAMWVVLPDRGELVGRLDDKIPPYRLKRGRVQYEARQLDATRTVPRQPIGVDAYGDIWVRSRWACVSNGRLLGGDLYARRPRRTVVRAPSPLTPRLEADASRGLSAQHQRAAVLRRHLDHDENPLPVTITGDFPGAEG